MIKYRNIHLGDDSIVMDIYESVSVCRRDDLTEVTIPSVADISFAPKPKAFTLFLGTSDGAFRMFVDSFSEIRLGARRSGAGEKFTYHVIVGGAA